MNILTTLIKPLAYATVGLAAALLSANASAQTVSNTAFVEWDQTDGRVQRPSNRVDLLVEAPPPTAPISITTFQFDDPPGGGTQINLPETQCRTENGSTPITLNGIFSDLETAPASLSPRTEIAPNEPLVIFINSPSHNEDPDEIETFDIELTTEQGDREVISVTETGANTGDFVGVINTTATPPAPIQGNCILSVAPGSDLSIDIFDDLGGDLLGTISVEILIDPFGLVFDSADGTPVSGARVTLIDNATGLPATVFGDDGVSAFPSSIITGSTVTDSGGTVYNFDPGFYRFPFARPGDYRLVVEPPPPPFT